MSGKSSLRRQEELDGLRGMACLFVLLAHYFVLPLQPESNLPQVWIWWFAVSVLGFFAVDCFFVLSGYLIGGILLDYKNAKNFFKSFYIRRACRIFPTYYLVIGSLLLAIGLGIGSLPTANAWLLKDLLPMWSYATFTQGIVMSYSGVNVGARWLAQTWSLSVEEMFYLVAPFLVRFVSRRLLVNVLIASILLAPFLRRLATDNGIWHFTLMPCRMDSPAMGVLIACLVRNEKTLTWLRERKGVLEAVLGVLFVIYCVSFMFMPGQDLNRTMSLSHSLHALFSATLILLLTLHRKSWIAWLFRLRALCAMGAISYTVYLIHDPVLGLLHLAVFNAVPRLTNGLELGLTVFSCFVVVAISTLSYHYIEKRILAWGRQKGPYDEVDEQRQQEREQLQLTTV